MVEDAKVQKTADLSGVTFSLLCAIHCAITPLIFMAKPLVDHAAHSDHHHHHHHHGPDWWGLIDYVFLILGFLAVYYSTKHTSHKLYTRLLWLFYALFAASLILEKLHIEIGHWLTYLSAFALATTHILHYRHCRRCERKEL